MLWPSKICMYVQIYYVAMYVQIYSVPPTLQFQQLVPMLFGPNCAVTLSLQWHGLPTGAQRPSQVVWDSRPA